MNWSIEEFVDWLAAEEEASSRELPVEMSENDFLRYWIELGQDPSRHVARLSPDQVDDLIWHASFYLDYITWWRDEGGKEVDPELKVSAVAASPAILEAASRATSARCMGCLMFWEEIAGLRRNIEGGRQIWQTVGDALRIQEASASDDCMAESVRHGLEHYAQTEAEGW